MGYLGSYLGAGSGGGDVTPPTVTIVSPTPGVAPGDPGGFPRDIAAARATPIVLRVVDLAPGLLYFAIVVRFYVDSEDANPTEEVVFRRGNFRGLYVKGSSYALISNGLELTVARRGGWPASAVGASSSRPYIAFAVDAVDADGNLSP